MLLFADNVMKRFVENDQLLTLEQRIAQTPVSLRMRSIWAEACLNTPYCSCLYASNYTLLDSQPYVVPNGMLPHLLWYHFPPRVFRLSQIIQ